MIDISIIDSLPDDEKDALLSIINDFYEFDRSVNSESNTDDDGLVYDGYVQYLGLVKAFCESRNLNYGMPTLSGNESYDVDALQKFFTQLGGSVKKERANILLESSKSTYLHLFNNPFCYEFSDSDLDRVQVLINEIRDLISTSELFDDKHKGRLLKRLERLQSELNKKVSDLDRFWGLIGDAGVALGKFGKDVKPLVDRIKELTTITWKTQAKAEELPPNSPLPLLGDTTDDQ